MALKYNRLTQTNLRALKAGQSLMEHGIIAARHPSGDLSWRVNVMVDGRRYNRSVGKESDGVTRTQAEQLIEKFRTEAREGRLNLPKGRKTAIGFEEGADNYIKILTETGGKNLKPKGQHLRQHLKPYFTTSRLDQIDSVMVDRYRARRRATGASEATINREMATLSHLFRKAVEWKWIRAEAVPPITKTPEPTRQGVILNDEEADRLLQAAKADIDDRLWLFVACGLGAAMRHREILAIRYDQIDFDNARIHIPKAKAGQRDQPITPRLAKILKEQRDKEAAGNRTGWVFPSQPGKKVNKHPHCTNMGRQFARAVKAAKLEGRTITPHTMRHTAITRLVQAGVDLPTIQKISGHKTLAMVLHYTHVYGQHIDNAMLTLDAGLVSVTPKLHQAT